MYETCQLWDAFVISGPIKKDQILENPIGDGCNYLTFTSGSAADTGSNQSPYAGLVLRTT